MRYHPTVQDIKSYSTPQYRISRATIPYSTGYQELQYPTVQDIKSYNTLQYRISRATIPYSTGYQALQYPTVQDIKSYNTLQYRIHTRKEGSACLNCPKQDRPANQAHSLVPNSDLLSKLGITNQLTSFHRLNNNCWSTLSVG